MAITSAKRFNVLDCGRRFGKTAIGVNRLVDCAVRGNSVAWFSPTYKMLMAVWREVCATLEPVTARKLEDQHRIELRTGGAVDMWSLDSADTVRGRPYKRVIIDEAAMVPKLAYAWQQVIRPTLTDYVGDAWIMSTPKGHNEFWRMWNAGQEPDSDWRSWQFPTASNPYILATEIESARRELPERVFAQEYLATFLDDGGGVLRGVLDAAIAEEQSVAAKDHQYVIGADWGRSGDFTAFAVVDVTLGACVALDRSNKIEYVQQRGRLRALADRFGPTAIVAEANAMGDPIIEMLRRDGLPVQPFTTTNATKAAIIDGLALAFEQGVIRILPDPVLIAELQAYEAERLPSGLIRYGAPEGSHDDTVIALALAWHGASQKPARLSITKNIFYG